LLEIDILGKFLLRRSSRRSCGWSVRTSPIR